ncbi:eCIS core domain-containing protein [Streptomyces murinus]|uniref:eCIS core domain-containing protein n=1 Tax=Streptomyces murinus TaxID=33900 RepID=UPI003F456F91
MTAHTQDPGAQQSAEQRRRKRRERAAKSRTPEPKNIVSGAGQPLDPGVRRELEDQLGHDLSRVRLHTDRDAARLTELLGADAVAVGQDVLFRSGAFKPGTTEGHRLLAHELLHTVQNPHGLGALRAGREPGAVSLPQQAIEQEAESAAQALARPSTEEAAPRVTENQSSPGWLRYATVDADRMRAEAIDPATLVDRIAGDVMRSLRGDPTDASGRVRLQLARISDELENAVVERLENRLLTPEYDQLLEIADRARLDAVELQPAETPLPEIDLFEELGVERIEWKKKQESERGSADQRAADTREEQRDTKARDAKAGGDHSRARADAATEEEDAAQRTEQEDTRNASRQRTEQEEQEKDEQAATDRAATDRAADERAQGRQEGTEQAQVERKEQREREEADPQQATAPGADKRKRRDDQTQPAAGSKQQEPDPGQKAQPGPVRPEKVDERAEQPDSALSEHGLDEKDEDGGAEAEPREEERPLGLEAGADQELAGGGDKGAPASAERTEPALQPEDYLPEADLDLSAVPTADKVEPGAAEPSLPAFPTPPPTKAEKTEQERERNEQEQDEDDAQPDQKAPGQDEGPVEGEAAQPENGPVAQAQDRGARDLQETDKPLDQEVGPDLATQDKERPEPETEKPDPEQEQAEDGVGDGGASRDEERPDAKDGQEEKDQLRERAAAESRTTATSPAMAGPAPTVTSPVAAAVSRPAGARTPKTPVEDRDPSPATRRDAEPPRSEREAPQAKSRVPKESGPGAAPRGPVGASEKTGPAVGAGPGAAPSVAQAAVSPAAEQSDGPGQTAATDAPRPEASLEKDGGGCAPPAPAPEKDEGGQGGCGGGGEAAPEQKQEEPPDVSGQDPKTAVGTVSKLAPDQAAAAMPGVDKAADKKIADEQKRLDAAPPTRERPSGAPQTRSAPPQAAPAAPQVTGKVERIGPEGQDDKQKAKGGEKAEGSQPAANVPPPPPPAAPDKGLSEAEAKHVEATADSIPTTDPALENKTVGPAPKIRLEGASDPTRTDDQAKALKDKQADLQATGREDAAKPMGEDQIFPNAPREKLTGKASGGSGGGKDGALEATPAPKAGVGAVAKQEKGTEITGAAGKAQGDLGAKEKEHQQSEQKAKQDKQTEIDREVERNTAQQTAERGRVAQETHKQREDWRAEQDKKVEDADKQSGDEHDKKNKEIVKARDDKDKEIGARKDKDNAQIDTERDKAEKDAKKKKEEKKPSGGLLGWVASKVADFFKGLLAAVTAIFDAARKAVNGIIDTFKQWADQAIDFVRDLAVKAINALADVLIALGDTLLAAFPALRDRFRKAIEGLRDAAVATVNRLADGLKKAVNTLLDTLAAGLNKLLDVLEAGVKAVIKAYQSVIVGALKFAQAAIAALGKFAALVADIAPDPGGWISKAASAAKTGITDHLWGAIKVAVKQWFDTKVEGIIGLGKAVIDVLVKGCVSIKQIGKMAWDAVIASLPMMIASLVIEKVVSMIVPAAGAILTIVQGLMAAWQTVSSILSAFGKFWAYLKAVKAGPAACLFAEAVAAGVVALLDFLTNLLLQRLSSATKGVGKRLKAMAQKIMDGLKKVGGGAKKAAGAAVNSARGALRKARQALSRPGTERKPKGEPSPEPKSPVKPKDHATPKGPARKPDGPETRPKDAEAGAGKDRSPAEERTPDRDRGPEREKTGSEDKKPETAPKKKQKEIEGPKPTKPKKPKSPVAKALSKAKGAVKSALKKVGNAAKTLGRKLKKSKVGKALKNGASKLRNFFKKKKDQLRDHKKRQQEQKRRKQDQRKKDEKSKESKEARLQKILGRVRPSLKRLLDKGVPGPVLSGVSAAMRTWYRLTGLAVEGADKFNVRAWLNPSEIVVGGVRIRLEELMREVGKISLEITQKKSRPRAQNVVSEGMGSNGRYVTRFAPDTPPEGIAEEIRRREELNRQGRLNRTIRPGVYRGAPGSVEEFEIMGDPASGTPAERVPIEQGASKDLSETKAHVSSPLTPSTYAPTYKQLDHWLQHQSFSPARRRQLSTLVLDWLKTGQTPHGAQDRPLAAGLGVWQLGSEGARTRTANVIGAMLFDAGASNRGSLEEAVQRHPLRGKSAKQARKLDENLEAQRNNENFNVAKRSKAISQRYGNFVEYWAGTQDDIVDWAKGRAEALNDIEVTEGQRAKLEREFFDMVRQRMLKLHGL